MGPRIQMAWLGMLCATALPLGANASSLQVSPTTLVLSGSQQAEGLWLSNSGTTPIRAQVRVETWTQTANQDTLADSHEVVASPPMIEIAAGAQQLVRIVRLAPVPPQQESAYRLLIDELPDASSLTPPSGLNFLLRYSIPVFVDPAAPQAAHAPTRAVANAPPALTDLSALHAQLLPAPGDGPTHTAANARPAWRWQVVNTGAARIKITELRYCSRVDACTTLLPGLVGYVLAGQTMSWSIPPRDDMTGRLDGTFEAKFNQDRQFQPIALRPAPAP